MDSDCVQEFKRPRAPAPKSKAKIPQPIKVEAGNETLIKFEVNNCLLCPGTFRDTISLLDHSKRVHEIVAGINYKLAPVSVCNYCREYSGNSENGMAQFLAHVFRCKENSKLCRGKAKGVTLTDRKHASTAERKKMLRRRKLRSIEILTSSESETSLLSSSGGKSAKRLRPKIRLPKTKTHPPPPSIQIEGVTIPPPVLISNNPPAPKVPEKPATETKCKPKLVVEDEVSQKPVKRRRNAKSFDNPAPVPVQIDAPSKENQDPINPEFSFAELAEEENPFFNDTIANETAFHSPTGELPSLIVKTFPSLQNEDIISGSEINNNKIKEESVATSPLNTLPSADLNRTYTKTVLKAEVSKSPDRRIASWFHVFDEKKTGNWLTFNPPPRRLGPNRRQSPDVNPKKNLRQEELKIRKEVGLSRWSKTPSSNGKYVCIKCKASFGSRKQYLYHVCGALRRPVNVKGSMSPETPARKRLKLAPGVWYILEV